MCPFLLHWSVLYQRTSTVDRNWGPHAKRAVHDCMHATICADFFRVGSGNARLGVHHVELALGHAWARAKHFM